MKVLYLECAMGAAGDMLTAALMELMPDPDEAVAELNALGLPKVRYEWEKSTRKGIAGTLMHVYVDSVEEGEPWTDHAHDHGHSHAAAGDHAAAVDHDHAGASHEPHHDDDHCPNHKRHEGFNMRDIMSIVGDLDISEDVRGNILSVFGALGDAESTVHGQSISQIHFHEVGSMDAIADIAAVCLLIHKLAPVHIIVSPIHVGSGTVRCAHGVLPVPAPATALLLKDVPVYSRKDITGELCTPTGAALLTHFADEFSTMPRMLIEKIGCGLGKKDFASPNCVRAFLGELWQSEEENGREEAFYLKAADDGASAYRDTIVELACNLDDMTPEAISFAIDRLYEAGAAEVFTVSAGMKKNRPGTLLTVLVKEQAEKQAVEALFRHTSTIGIRRSVKERYILRRQIEEMETPFGVIRKKVAEGYGVSRSKMEYDDLSAAAVRTGMTLDELRGELQ